MNKTKPAGGKRQARECFLRGLGHYRAGDLTQAQQCFALAVQAHPAHAEAQHGLGLLTLQQGDAAAALPHLLRATEADPDKAAYFLNLGVALRQLQRHGDALAAYDRALELEPDSAMTHNNRGNILRGIERLDAALKDYERALELQPDYAEAHYNRGALLQKLGRLDDAMTALAEAVRLRPGYVEALNTRGNVLRDLGRWDDARAEYDRAIAAANHVTPPAAIADAHFNRAAVLRDQGDGNAAVADLRAALAARPDFPQASWALTFAGLTPVHDNAKQMRAARTLFAQELKLLSADCRAEPGRLADWEPAVGAAQPFYLSYHGFNERASLSKYGALACDVMAAWRERHAPVRPLGDPAATTRERIRVGFVSAQVHRHSVWDVLTRGWLTQLDRQKFAVTCYHVGWRRDRETAVARKSADTFVMGPRPLSAWVDRISRDRPDVLIYPEIGMDPMTVKLAALRLAPVQCVSWGHPLTSGLPTMDYFLSADWLEPAGADSHYSESLVRLPNLGCYFEPLNPALPVGRDLAGLSISRRAEARPTAGLLISRRDKSRPTNPGALKRAPHDDPECPRFICCQQVAKYHPDFDEVFVRIAQELGRCRFTFVELGRTHGAWEKFRLRLERAFAASGLKLADYCAFLPTLPRREFLAVLQQQDVYLDTLSFSGFTTAIQAMSCDGLPVVTREGEMLRQRLAAGILRRIGVADTIAASADEYVEIAVRLGRDAEWREALRRRITASLEQAYRDEKVIKGLEGFLLKKAR